MSHNYQNTRSANADQVGQAAALRHGELSQEDRRTVNQIIHSGDRNPHMCGPNPYADPTKSYDQNAQEALNKISAKYGK